MNAPEPSPKEISVGVQDEASKQQLEAQANAHLSLMPLALPAPPVGGADSFAAPVYGAPINAFAAPQMAYGA